MGPVPSVGHSFQGDVDTWSDLLDRPSRTRFQSAPWARFFGVVDSLYNNAARRRRRRRAPFSPPRARLHRTRPADRQGASAARRCARAARTRPSPPRGSPGRGRCRRRRRPLRLRRSRERRRHRVRISPCAEAPRGLVRQCFDGRLPSRIGEWLASPSRGQPLRVERNGTRLVVEAPTRGGLIVAEERARPPLTAREVEVLRGLAAGKSTPRSRASCGSRRQPSASTSSTSTASSMYRAALRRLQLLAREWTHCGRTQGKPRRTARAALTCVTFQGISSKFRPRYLEPREPLQARGSCRSGTRPRSCDGRAHASERLA
jgi:hypothetical protein